MPTRVTDAEVNLYARDPEALAACYQGLGSAERFRFPTSGVAEHVEVSVGTLTLGVTRTEALERLAGLSADPGRPRSVVVSWCDVVVAIYARKLELGATSVAPPRVFNDRLRAAWIVDPEGHRVKLLALLAP